MSWISLDFLRNTKFEKIFLCFGRLLSKFQKKKIVQFFVCFSKSPNFKTVLVFTHLYSGELTFWWVLVIWNHCAAEAALIRRDLLGNFTEEPVRPLWPSLVQAASTAYDYILPLSAVPTAKSTAADITASACRREERLRHTVSLDDLFYYWF